MSDLSISIDEKMAAVNVHRVDVIQVLGTVPAALANAAVAALVGRVMVSATRWAR